MCTQAPHVGKPDLIQKGGAALPGKACALSG
jgi:hypothetical protein